mmetsp:Transcript_17779/g.47958  ORF Transcript_17779/g.47958 Transcript_17779/m.47958 type:complete len:264 (-) Transcript_17779:4926-5717(-)
MPVALLYVDRACIPLHGDPAFLRVSLRPGLDTPQLLPLVLRRTLHHLQSLANVKHSDRLSLADVEARRHGHGRSAHEQSRELKTCAHANILQGGPAHFTVLTGLAADTLHLLRPLLLRPLDSLDNLSRLHDTDLKRKSVEALRDGRLLLASRVRFRHALQEDGALVAPKSDPALQAVQQGPAAHARHANRLVDATRLKDLDDLVGINLSQRFAVLHLGSVRHGDLPHTLPVVLQHLKEADLRYACSVSLQSHLEVVSVHVKFV